MPIYGNTTTSSNAFTAFDGIPFRIMADSSGVYGAWDAPMIRAERHVPRSNRVYRQNMGAGLAKITIRLEFRNLDDFRRFKMAEASDRKARLTLLADYVSLRGIPSTIHRDYEHYDNVVIDQISNESIGVDRVPVCTATFAAAWDPLTMQVVP